MKVRFTHESGSPDYVVPAYFAADGNAAETSASEGNKWRAHLSPDKIGKWSYEVYFVKGAYVATTDVPAAVPALQAATPGIGQPTGGWDLQTPVTDIAVEAHNMVYNVLNPLMFVVAVFVLILLAWTMFRYRAAANPVPSKNSHNTVIEVIWTVVPALILVVIAFPSFRLLANQYDPPKADITIKQDSGALKVLDGAARLADVVKALNSLGATAQDLIAILQALKAAGSLKAELEII